jgi:hypothetical protein
MRADCSALCIKLVIEISVYYDAWSKNIKKKEDGMDKCFRKHRNNFVVNRGNLLHTKTRK